MVVSHFLKLWDIIRRENSKIKASPFFFWIFTPVLISSMVANWFDLRLIIGTAAWVALAYGFGSLIIDLAETNAKVKPR